MSAEDHPSRSLRFRWGDVVREAPSSLVDPIARAVAWVLQAHMDTKGRCFPGTERLAHGAGTTRKTAADRVKRLERAGFLEIDRRNGAVNRYQALIPETHVSGGTTSPSTQHLGRSGSQPGSLRDQTWVAQDASRVRATHESGEGVERSRTTSPINRRSGAAPLADASGDGPALANTGHSAGTWRQMLSACREALSDEEFERWERVWLETVIPWCEDLGYVPADYDDWPDNDRQLGRIVREYVGWMDGSADKPGWAP